MSPTWLDDPDTEVAPEVLDGWLEEAVGGPLRGRQGGHRVRDLDRGVTYPSVRAAGRELGGVAARLSMALSRHGGFATVDGHHLCFAEHYERLGREAALARCPAPRERRERGGHAAGREREDMGEGGEDKNDLEGRAAGGQVPRVSAPPRPSRPTEESGRDEALRQLAESVVRSVEDMPEFYETTRYFRAPGDRTNIMLSCMREEDGFAMTCSYLDVSESETGRTKFFSSAGRISPEAALDAELAGDAREAALKLARAGRNAWADAHARGLAADGPSDRLVMRVADWVRDESDGLVTRREAMGIAREDLSRDPKGLADRISKTAAKLEGLALEVKEHGDDARGDGSDVRLASMRDEAERGTDLDGKAAGREREDMGALGEDKRGLEGTGPGSGMPAWSASLCPGAHDEATASRVEAIHGLASAVVEAVKDLPAGEPAVRTYMAPGDRTAVELSCMRSEMPDGFETTCAYLDVSDTAAGRSEAFSSAGRLGPGVRDLTEFSDDEHEAALKLTRAGQNAWADAHAKGLVAEGPQDLLPMRVADWVMDEGDGLVTRREAMGIAAEDLSRDPKGLAARIAENARDEGLASAYREKLGRLAAEVSSHEGAAHREAPSGTGSEGRGREAESPELPGGRG